MPEERPERPPLERIEVDGRVGFGRPRVRGTRVPIHVLLARLAAGLDEAGVAAEYGIEVDDVRAALAWAANRIAEGREREGGS